MHGVIYLILGIAVIAGLTFGNEVKALTDAASGLTYTAKNVQLHKVDLAKKEISVKLDASFVNPSQTQITLSNLVVRLSIPGQNNTWLIIAETAPTGNFTIGSGETLQPLKFTAPIANEYSTLIPSLISGNEQTVLVEVFPQIRGRNLDPVSVVENINLKSVLDNFLNTKLGLGYTGEGEKNIIETDKYDRFFSLGSLERTDKVISSGSHYGTLDEMENIVKATLSDTQAIAQHLKKSSVPETLKSVFNWVNDHFQYREDQPGMEDLRRPLRSYEDRIDGIDCDCMSILQSSILTNLNIPHSYRMAAYNGSNEYSHVYVVAQHNGKEYTLDPVVGKWNTEHGPISKKYDKRVNA